MNATAAPFDLFAPGAAATATLVAMRLTGLVLVAPVFSAKLIPVKIRTALIVAFTIVLAPVALGRTTTVPHITPGSAIGETLVGFAIGLGVAVIVGAAEAAGDLIATQTGLSGASLLDPLNGTSSPALSNFLSMFTVTVLLALNVHLDMIAAIGASLRAIPVGSALDMQHGLGAMVGMGSLLFSLGLRFAAPVVATVMIGNTALAVLSRAAPQLNILSIAFPLQIGLGLVALALTIPLLATFLGDWSVAGFESQTTALFGAFAGGH